MKILHTAIFNMLRQGEDYYSTNRKFSLGLTRSGHFVYDYSYRDMARCLSPIKSKRFGIKRMNQDLLNTIDNIQPDLLLLGHCELIDNLYLKYFRKNYKEMKIAMWYVDPLYIRSDYIGKLEFLDAFFATTAGPDLVNLHKHTDGKVMFIPNICDSSVDSLRGFENPNPQIDLSFIGIPTNSTVERTEFVKKLSKTLTDINFQLFGGSRKSRVFGTNYLKTIYNSKMSLSLNRVNDRPMYTSDRLVHLAANGTAVISPEVPELRKLFKGDEIIYFGDFQDLIEKIHYYLSRPEERIEIAKAGHAKAHASFNSTRICKYMLESLFGKNYSEKYEWLY